MKFNIKTDSRKVKKGDIFVALKTALGDGHDYIEKAISNGASLIVANHGEYSVETIIVDDTRKYLNDYLVDNYKIYLDELVIFGVTGTNGKTTTTHLIYEALNYIGLDCALIGTIGYFLKEGKVCYLPNSSPDICDTYELILDAYNKGHKYISLECSSHGLFENRLFGIKFDYAIFTNLTRDHLDFHGNYDNYVEAKKILFKNLKENGKALINSDDSYYKRFMLDNNNITFGKKGDLLISDLNLSLDKSEFKLNDEVYSTGLIAEYNIYNLVPAIYILKDLGYKYNEIKQVIKKLSAPYGRVDRIKYGTNNIYIDYAHTPDGLEKVVSSVRDLTEGNTYTVFCCRGNRDIGRRSGMMQAAVDNSTLAIVTNDHIFSEDPMNVIKDMLVGLDGDNYEIITNRKEAIYRGIDLLKENDSLLILGHGHEEVLINEKHEKEPFIEKDIVNDYIKSKC